MPCRTTSERESRRLRANRSSTLRVFSSRRTLSVTPGLYYESNANVIRMSYAELAARGAASSALPELPLQAGDQTLIVLHDECGDFPLVEAMKAAHSQVL